MPLDPDAVKLVRTEGVQQDLAVVALWLKNLACTCHAPLPPPTPPSCQAVRGGLLLPQSMKPPPIIPLPPVKLCKADSYCRHCMSWGRGWAILNSPLPLWLALGRGARSEGVGEPDIISVGNGDK